MLMGDPLISRRSRCAARRLASTRCLEEELTYVGLLPGLDLLGLEPESDLLLGVLDRVRAVADVAADVLSCISVSAVYVRWMEGRTMAKSPRMVPGAEARGLVAPRMTRPVLTASRPSQTMAATGPEPMSGAMSAGVGLWDSCAARTGNEGREEGLVAQVGIVLLEVLLGGSDKLDGSELEAAVLEAGDDVANEATLLYRVSRGSGSGSAGTTAAIRVLSYRGVLF